MQQDQQLFFYLNLARTDPQHYVRLIQKQLDEFQNDLELVIKQDIIYQTNEGKKAWEQALQFLQKQQKLPKLMINQGLSSAAKLHIQDMSKNGIFGHIGSDNSSFSQRIERFCVKSSGSMVQIIGADFQIQGRNSLQMIILGLIIDDGVLDRGHRQAIFSPQYKYVGFASGTQQDKIIAVLNISEKPLELKKSQSTIQQKSVKRSSMRSEQSKGTYQNMQKQNICQMEPSFKKSYNAYNAQVGKNSYRSKLFSQASNKTPRINQSGIYKLPTITDLSHGKSVVEKKQSVRTLYENGYKISQITIKIKFNDGSIEENTERITTFIE